MSGRLLNTTLLLLLSSFPALGLLLTTMLGAFGGMGWAAVLVVSAVGSGAIVLLARSRGWSAILDEPRASFVRPGGLGWAALAVGTLAFVPTL